MKQYLIACLLLTGLAACNNKGKETSKEEEPEPSAFTLYTDKTELFVECKPLVVGEESRFTAHVTMLGGSFTPITSGSVSLTLSGAGEQQSIKADAPADPGIFRLALTPAKPGVYKLVFNIQTTTYTDQIIIDSVTVYPDTKTAMQAQLPEAAGSNEITYRKEQAWKIDFATMPVKRAAFYNVVKTSGQITAAAGDEQTLTARTAGVVNILKQGLYAGLTVQAGQPLFSISSKGFTGNNIDVQIQEAANNLSKAKADLERSSDLYKDRLITQREYLQVKNEYDNAAALYRSLANSYNQGKGQTVAPGRTGFVRSLLVTQGQFVEAGQPLAVITANKQLAVKAEIAQSAYSKINTITSANFKINQRVYSLEELNGKLASVGKSADNALFIPVFFSIDNKDGLLPGAFIEVFIKTDTIDNALVIPMTAILEEQGNYYCYVQTAGETFEKRALTIAGNDGQQVQVVSGISAGERVVVKGAYNIKLSTVSGAVPAHGDEH